MTDMTKKNRLLGRNAAENGKQRKTRIFAVERAAHQTLDVVLAWLSATPAGLSAEEAKKRLDIYGRNEVAQEKAPPVYRQLLGAYNSPFIYVLLVLVAISCFTDVWLPLAQGEEAEPAGIVIMSTMIDVNKRQALAADVTLYGVIDTGLVFQHADADMQGVDTVDTFQKMCIRDRLIYERRLGKFNCIFAV